MSDYFDNLKRLKEQAANNDFGDKISVKDAKIIKSALTKVLAQQIEYADSFVFFYESVINDDLGIDFEEILGTDNYSGASMYSDICLGEAKTMKEIPRNIRIGIWIPNALKFIDYVVTHYIQEVRKEIPDNNLILNDNTSYGEERLRYKMLQRYEQNVSNAGSWLLKMYELRTRLTHNTQKEKGSNKHVFRIENYSQISKSAANLYPKILQTFKVLYS